MREVLGGCLKENPRLGGIFYECAKGFRIGASGPEPTVNQVRIGAALDMECNTKSSD